MSEKSANRTLSDRLIEAHFKVYRVENKVGPGHADFHFLAPFVLDYKAGWIESKWIAKLPPKMSDPVRIKFQPDQPPWIWGYREHGGRVWISLLVGEGPKTRWMLFDGCWVHRLAFVPGRTRVEDLPTRGELEERDRWLGVEDWATRAQTIALADFQLIQSPSPALVPPKRSARAGAPKKRAAKKAPKKSAR